MRGDIWIRILSALGIIVVSIGLSLFIFLHYFHQTVVVLDLKDLVAYERQKTAKMKQEEAVEEVGNFFKKLSEDLEKRDEIVLVKDAVLNSNRFKDITNEYKR